LVLYRHTLEKKLRDGEFWPTTSYLDIGYKCAYRPVSNNIPHKELRFKMYENLAQCLVEEGLMKMHESVDIKLHAFLIPSPDGGEGTTSLRGCFMTWERDHKN
jgi:hypothetical protein